MFNQLERGKAAHAAESRSQEAAPDPEVLTHPKRRRFTAEYKLRILAEVDKATAPGGVGRILRREGLYSSHLVKWRAERAQAQRAGLEPKRRGPKPQPKHPSQDEARQLRRENERLKKQLQRAELLIELQKKGISALRGDPADIGRCRLERGELVQLVNEHTESMDVAGACQVMGLARGTYYRQACGPKLDLPARANRRSPRALTELERARVMNLLTSERFCDDSPREVYATVLDEGRYLCSVPTMYRILRSSSCVRERRDQLQHPPYPKPELLATGPNQAWSWDITKLLGPAKWTYFYLHVILDIFSRYVVGWGENAECRTACGCASSPCKQPKSEHSGNSALLKNPAPEHVPGCRSYQPHSG